MNFSWEAKHIPVFIILFLYSAIEILYIANFLYLLTLKTFILEVKTLIKKLLTSMNKNSLKELVKNYFNLTEVKEVVAAKFQEITLEDGSVISNQAEGDIAVGDTLYAMKEEGAVAILGGEVMLPDGREIYLDEAGVITEIKEAGLEEPVEGSAEEAPVAEEAMSQLSAEDIVSAIAEMVNGKFESIEVKMKDMEAKVEKFAKAPAVEKTVLNKFSKTEEVIADKRYALALKQIKK